MSKEESIFQRRILPLLLVMGILLFGSLNTIMSKYQNRQSYLCEEGTYDCVPCPDPEPYPDACIPFEQPFFQSVFTFVGEFICMVVFVIMRACQRMNPPKNVYERLGPAPPKVKGWSYLLFAIPAGCDLLGTTLMNMGLIYTHASVYQMLRGIVVVFTAILTTLALKRKHYPYHWTGVFFVVMGVGVVGLVSIVMNDSQVEPASNPLLGDILVIAAQFFLSLQMVTEEKFVGQFDAHPLEVVGLEGVTGLTMIVTLLVIFQVTLGNSGETGNMFDVRFAMALFVDFLPIMIPSFFLCVGYACTNFSGVYTTKILGATARTTIEQCRTLIIWIFSISVGWESFLWPQIIGFVILIGGTFMYNKVFRCPGFYYPDPEDKSRSLTQPFHEKLDSSSSIINQSEDSLNF